MEAGVREKKSAKVKLDILISAIQLLGKSSFKDIYVDHICEKAHISKVTFFKYFPQKEDILLYYLRIWCLDRAVELHHQPREGLSGVYYLFDHIAATYEKNPGLILNLISYMTSLSRPPAPFPLKSIERAILYPHEADLDNIEIFSLYQLMEKFLLEAIFNKEITVHSDTKALATLFMSIMYGSIVTGHTRQLKPMQLFFRRNLEALLGGLR